MYQKSNFLVFVLIIFNLSLYAQLKDTIHLSIEEAKDYALENNMLIRNAKLKTVASRKQVWETIAQGLPQAGVMLDYIDYFNYELEFSFGGVGTLPDNIVTLLNEVNDPASHDLFEMILTPSGPTSIILDNSSTVMLQVNQLIFSGQYLVGIKTAQIAEKITEQSLQKTQEDVKELIATSYYLVLLNEESLRIINQSLKNLEKIIKQTEAMFIAGIAEQSDIDQIKIAHAMLKNTKSSMQRSLELNYNMLRFQLGIEHDKTFVLTDSLEGIIEKVNLGQVTGIPFNYENNIDYKILMNQELLTKKMIDMEKMNYLPTIGGYYSYNEKLLTTDFDMTPKNIAGINLSWNIFTSNMRNAKLQQAKIEYDIIQNTKSMMEEQLILKESQYRNDLISAIDNYQLQKENLQLSNRVYENIQRKYNQGVVSSLDLTQASDNNLEAHNNYLNAIMNVLRTKLALDKLLSNL